MEDATGRHEDWSDKAIQQGHQGLPQYWTLERG